MHPSVTFLSKILHFVCLWDSFIKFLVECENNRCSLQFSIILAIVGPVSGLFAVFQLGIKWKASADVSSANVVVVVSSAVIGPASLRLSPIVANIIAFN